MARAPASVRWRWGCWVALLLGRSLDCTGSAESAVAPRELAAHLLALAVLSGKG